MKILYRVILLFAGLGLSPATAAPPVIADPLAEAAPAVARPSESEALDFVKVYSPSDLRRNAEIRLLQTEFLPGLRQDPSTAKMLDAYPALGQAMVEAMVSQIDTYIAEYDERFFPRAAALVRESLSRDDVVTLAAFYESPLGRKMLQSVAQKVDGKEVMERAVKGEDLDAGGATRQAFRAGIGALATLSAEEQKQIAQLAAAPAGRHFSAFSPQLVALQIELANAPGPKFSAAADQAMAAAFKQVTGIDLGAKK